MTNIKNFIEDALAGGYDPTENGVGFLPSKQVVLETVFLHRTLLDPEAWQAVGKTRGWKEDANLIVTLESYNTGPEHLLHHSMEAGYWRFYMHRFIDHLADGDDIDTALGKL